MIRRRLIVGLCSASLLTILYYFIIVDVHITPALYTDRTMNKPITFFTPCKLKQEESSRESTEPEMQRPVSSIKVSHDSIFIYRAYYDDRSSTGTVRVLLMSKCIKDPDFFEMRIETDVLPMKQRPVEGGRCPWAWAPGCKWNAYALESEQLLSYPEKVIIIVNKTREIEVRVNRIHKTKKDRMEICVPPLFWYTDWPRMILFFEMWKKHNPTFIIYTNSISRNVMKVLEFYQRQDLVKIVNWPMLPMAENGDNPNLSIYRLSHSLAHNDCVMRMEAEFGALVDIDEYLHLKNGDNLINFARAELHKKNNMGSWNFYHTGLLIKPLDETFEGVRNPESIKMGGPPKTFFRPETVKFLSTHRVNQHVNNTRRRVIPRRDGFLMHSRVTFLRGRNKGDNVDLRNHYVTVSPFTNKLFNSLLSISNEIYGVNLPHYENISSVVMQKCMNRWRSQGCKVPLINCRVDMLPLDDWMFMNATADSHYLVV